jgi:hypothetical protein
MDDGTDGGWTIREWDGESRDPMLFSSTMLSGAVGELSWSCVVICCFVR